MADRKIYMDHNETHYYSGVTMLKRIQNIDPMTKSLIAYGLLNAAVVFTYTAIGLELKKRQNS